MNDIIEFHAALIPRVHRPIGTPTTPGNPFPKLLEFPGDLTLQDPVDPLGDLVADCRRTLRLI